MEKNWTVYKHTFPDGKIYIGITGMDPERRWSNGHGYLGRVKEKYNQPLIAHAIVKYGWSNILHEIIASGLSKKEASKMEKSLVAEYKSNNPEFGYNIADGGLDGKTDRQREYQRKVSHPTRCNQTGIVYSSIKEAARKTGVCASSVRESCLYGKMYHGLSFSLVCDENLEEDFK